MKKIKIPALVLIAAMILQVLAACAGNGAPSSDALPDANIGDKNNLPGEGETVILPGEIPYADFPSGNDKPVTDEYYFIFKNYYILLNEDYEKTSAKIGAANDTFEAPSCAFEGVDKTFYYDDFSIATYPDGNKDFIMSITLTGENVKTPEGAGLGMGFDDMIKIYGEDYGNTFDLYFYDKGDTQLAFLFEDGILADISYYYLPAVNN